MGAKSWGFEVLLLAGCYQSASEAHDVQTDARVDGETTADVADIPVDLPDSPVDRTEEVDAYAGPWPILFRLRFVSDIPESVWVAAWDPASSSGGHWLRIDRGGTILRKADDCAVCGCDDCPGCPICGAPCMEATELPAGGTVEYLWDGVEYPLAVCPSAPSSTCEQPTIAGPVGPYMALMCWGAVVLGTGCDQTVGTVECGNVPFTIPDPDGVVEYTIDRGG